MNWVLLAWKKWVMINQNLLCQIPMKFMVKNNAKIYTSPKREEITKNHYDLRA